MATTPVRNRPKPTRRASASRFTSGRRRKPMPRAGDGHPADAEGTRRVFDVGARVAEDDEGKVDGRSDEDGEVGGAGHEPDVPGQGKADGHDQRKDDRASRVRTPGWTQARKREARAGQPCRRSCGSGDEHEQDRV